jgi:hypothetical protein
MLRFLQLHGTGNGNRHYSYRRMLAFSFFFTFGLNNDPQLGILWPRRKIDVCLLFFALVQEDIYQVCYITGQLVWN